jgi:hypothetical protein
MFQNTAGLMLLTEKTFQAVESNRDLPCAETEAVRGYGEQNRKKRKFEKIWPAKFFA